MFDALLCRNLRTIMNEEKGNNYCSTAIPVFRKT